MALDQTFGVFRSLWGLWVMIFFCGVVLWVYRPKATGPTGANTDAAPRNEDNEER
jgi:cbb3-type cytochrome oxidase subunit 3